MYYILHKPYGTEEPWTELPEGIRSGKEARATLKALVSQTKEDGTRKLNAKLCIGKGRDRRDIIRL